MPSVWEELAQRAQQGDQQALSSLLEELRKPIFALVRRLVPDVMEAEDLTTMILVRVFQNLDTYRVGASFRAWVFRIARNAIYDHWRKQNRNRQKFRIVSLSEEIGEGSHRRLREETIPSADPTPAQQTIQRSYLEFISRVIHTLPEMYRTILLLRYEQDLTYEEISQKLGVPVGTVKGRLARARRVLVARLRELRELREEEK